MSWKCGASTSFSIADDTTWDGAAAKASTFDACGWPDHPNPDKAKQAFLFYDDENAENKGAYKCPFCVAKGGIHATKGGIRAASNRVKSTDVPPEVKARGQAVIDDYEKRAGMGPDADAVHHEEYIMPYTITEEHGIKVVRVTESIALPKLKVARINAERLTEALCKEDIPMIFPNIHALHADTITRNKTCYPEATLKGSSRSNTGIYSALRPYPIPLIKDHNSAPPFFGGEASDVYGRAIKSKMTEDAGTGTKAATMVMGVGHPHAVNQILAGNWLTVSMGSRAEEAFCGICGADLLGKEGCEHDESSRGWHVKIGAKNFQFHEMSVVNVPSDQYARITDSNTDPDTTAYGARSKEHIYNLADPTRKNLLEGCDETDRQNVDAIYERMDWLIEEFKPARKQYFIFHEAARVAENEVPVKVTNPTSLLSYEQISELPDAAFGMVLTDESTLKHFRRFPMTASMTSDQRAFVKQQIEAMKSLAPEQRTALLARVEAEDCAGTPITVSVSKENYTTLLDLVDGERQERAAWETCARAATLAEEAKVAEAARIEAERVATEAAVKAEAERVATEEAARTAEAARIEAERLAAEQAAQAAQGTTMPSELEALKAQLTAEQDKRRSLTVEMIVRQKMALHEQVTEGKTYDELVAYYQSKSLPILEAFLDELQSTFSTTNAVVVTDMAHVEQVANPVAAAITQAEAAAGVTPGGVTPPVIPVPVVTDLGELTALFGNSGNAAAAAKVKSQTFDLSY